MIIKQVPKCNCSIDKKNASNDCGGFQAPKGHLDTQLYPECEKYETSRNIVKKTVERRKQKKHKKSFNLKEFIKTSQLQK